MRKFLRLNLSALNVLVFVSILMSGCSTKNKPLKGPILVDSNDKKTQSHQDAQVNNKKDNSSYSNDSKSNNLDQKNDKQSNGKIMIRGKELKIDDIKSKFKKYKNQIESVIDKKKINFFSDQKISLRDYSQINLNIKSMIEKNDFIDLKTLSLSFKKMINLYFILNEANTEKSLSLKNAFFTKRVKIAISFYLIHTISLAKNTLNWFEIVPVDSPDIFVFFKITQIEEAIENIIDHHFFEDNLLLKEIKMISISLIFIRKNKQYLPFIKESFEENSDLKNSSFLNDFLQFVSKLNASRIDFIECEELINQLLEHFKNKPKEQKELVIDDFITINNDQVRSIEARLLVEFDQLLRQFSHKYNLTILISGGIDDPFSLIDQTILNELMANEEFKSDLVKLFSRMSEIVVALEQVSDKIEGFSLEEIIKIQKITDGFHKKFM